MAVLQFLLFILDLFIYTAIRWIALEFATDILDNKNIMALVFIITIITCIAKYLLLKVHVG